MTNKRQTFDTYRVCLLQNTARPAIPLQPGRGVPSGQKLSKPYPDMQRKALFTGPSCQYLLFDLITSPPSWKHRIHLYWNKITLLSLRYELKRPCEILLAIMLTHYAKTISSHHANNWAIHSPGHCELSDVALILPQNSQFSTWLLRFQRYCIISWLNILQTVPTYFLIIQLNWTFNHFPIMTTDSQCNCSLWLWFCSIFPFKFIAWQWVAKKKVSFEWNMLVSFFVIISVIWWFLISQQTINHSGQV